MISQVHYNKTYNHLGLVDSRSTIKFCNYCRPSLFGTRWTIISYNHLGLFGTRWTIISYNHLGLLGIRWTIISYNHLGLFGTRWTIINHNHLGLVGIRWTITSYNHLGLIGTKLVAISIFIDSSSHKDWLGLFTVNFMYSKKRLYKISIKFSIQI